jgi:hypothetical protein
VRVINIDTYSLFLIKHFDGTWPFARQRFDKHILEIRQSTAELWLLSSQRLGSHVFITKKTIFMDTKTEIYKHLETKQFLRN